MLTCWNSLKSHQIPFSFRVRNRSWPSFWWNKHQRTHPAGAAEAWKCPDSLRMIQKPQNRLHNCHNWRWFPYHFRMLFINFRTFCDAILETRLEMSNGNPSKIFPKIIRMIRPWIREKTFGILIHLHSDFPLTSLDHICSRLEQSYQCPGVCWCTDVTWDFTNKNGDVPMFPSGMTRWWT